MNPHLEELWSEWTFGRGHVKAFVQDLADEQLDMELPRKGLNTVRKHAEELIQVQTDYIHAIRTGGRLSLSYQSDEQTFAGTTSKKALLTKMNDLDSELHSLLETDDGTQHLRWFDNSSCSVSQFLAALIAHEAMHLGQLIAFCYSQHIPIPSSVSETLGLSG